MVLLCVQILSLVSNNSNLGLQGATKVLEAFYDAEVTFWNGGGENDDKTRQSLSKYYEASKELAIRLRKQYRELLPREKSVVIDKE